MSITYGKGKIFHTVLGHAAVSEVLRDGERFSSKAYELTTGIVMGHTILEMDEPEHGRYRGLLQKAFTKKALQGWSTELIRPVIEQCIDRFAGCPRPGTHQDHDPICIPGTVVLEQLVTAPGQGSQA